MKPVVRAAVRFALAVCLALPAVSLASAPEMGALKAMKAAARAQMTKAAPGTPVHRIDLKRHVDGWALLTLHTREKGGAPARAMVMVRRVPEGWKAVGGPATAFPQGQRYGAPDHLFREALSSPRVAGQQFTGKTATFQGQDIRFRHPADAGITRQKPAVRLVGPPVRSAIFQLPAYEITVEPIAKIGRENLDDWGYARLEKQMAASYEPEAPEAVYLPQSVEYYALNGTRVFQVDWFGGDSVRRELYLLPPGSARVIRMFTTVYPTGNNPAAPLARSVVDLLLQTLRAD